MIPLDTLTIYVIAALLYLVLPLNTWVALLRQRSIMVDLWCIGGMLGGTGILLVGLRNNAPDWLSYPVANSFIVLSFLLRIKSIHLDLGERNSTRLIGGVFLLFISFYLVFHSLGSATALSLWARLSMLLCTVWLVRVLCQVAVREHSRNALTMAFAYGLVVAAFVIMLSMTAAGSSTITRPLAGPASLIVVLAAILSSIIGHFSYIGLVLERSTRARATVAMENARVEAARQQSSALAALDRRRSLGSMTSSLSHALSQPLTAITIITQIARRKLRSGDVDTDALADQLEKIVLNVKRASQIIDHIRRFVRPAESQHEDVDIPQTVREVLQLLQQDLLKQRIELRLNLPAEPLTVNADPVQLSQVLMHALLNAIDASASQPSRTVQIEVSTHAGMAIVEIRDNGPGLDPATLAKAGTPFFTTKPGRMGLGLAVSRQIIATLQGDISVENAAQGGACTRLCLPLSRAPSASPAA